MNQQYTFKNQNMIAVYLTVPTQFVGLDAMFEWVRLRRAMSHSTFMKCIMHLQRMGFIQREPRASAGRYRQQTRKENGA